MILYVTIWAALRLHLPISSWAVLSSTSLSVFSFQQQRLDGGYGIPVLVRIEPR